MNYEFPGGPGLVIGLFGLLWMICGALYIGWQFAAVGAVFLVIAAAVSLADTRRTKDAAPVSVSAKPGSAPSLAGGIAGIAVMLFGILWMLLILHSFDGAGMFSLFGLVFVLGGFIQTMYHFRNRAGWSRRPEDVLPKSTRRAGGTLSIFVCVLSLAWIFRVRGTELSVTAWIAALVAAAAAVQTVRYFRK